MRLRRLARTDLQLRRERPFASECFALPASGAGGAAGRRCPTSRRGTGRLSEPLPRRARPPGRLRAARARPSRSRLLDAGRRSARDTGVRGQALPVPAGPRGAVGAIRDVDRAARRRAGAGDGVGAGAARASGAGALRPRAPAQRAALARRPRGRRPGRPRARARRRRRWWRTQIVLLAAPAPSAGELAAARRRARRWRSRERARRRRRRVAPSLGGDPGAAAAFRPRDARPRGDQRRLVAHEARRRAAVEAKIAARLLEI